MSGRVFLFCVLFIKSLTLTRSLGLSSGACQGRYDVVEIQGHD